jgi:transposase IS66-like protein/transposase IS66 family protein
VHVNNAAERALRGIAVGRHNWTFAGSDEGGRRAAAIHTLIETAKLNDVDPQAWLTDVGTIARSFGQANRRVPVLELEAGAPAKRCRVAAANHNRGCAVNDHLRGPHRTCAVRKYTATVLAGAIACRRHSKQRDIHSIPSRAQDSTEKGWPTVITERRAFFTKKPRRSGAEFLLR